MTSLQVRPGQGEKDSRGCVDLNNTLKKDPLEGVLFFNKDKKIQLRQEKILSSVENIGKKIDECSREHPKTLWTSIKVATWRNLAKIKLYFMKKGLENEGLDAGKALRFLNCVHTAYVGKESILKDSFIDLFNRTSCEGTDKQQVAFLKSDHKVLKDVLRMSLMDPQCLSENGVKAILNIAHRAYKNDINETTSFIDNLKTKLGIDLGNFTDPESTRLLRVILSEDFPSSKNEANQFLNDFYKTYESEIRPEKNFVDILTEKQGINLLNFKKNLAHPERMELFKALIGDSKLFSENEIKQYLNNAYEMYKDEIKPEPGKSFFDILQQKIGINLLDFEDSGMRRLFKAALTDPTFREIPLVISEGKKEKRDSISADMKEYGSKIMLPDEIRDKYETAETTEALAEAIEANREYAAQIGSGTQKDIYGGQIFENDLNRVGCNLKIIDEGTNKTINIMISNNPDFCGEENCLMSKDQKTGQRSSFMAPSIPKKEKLDAVLTQIKQQSQKQGLELKDSEAFSLLKQFVLGYRGQNGMTDLYSYTFDLLAENSLLLGLNDPNTYMKFSKQEEKVDLTCIIDEVGVSKVALVTGQEENVSQNYNFGFIYPKGIQNPQEKDILSELGVKSTPKRNDAGQITGWECPFRANPPTHFILYGGATPAENH